MANLIISDGGRAAAGFNETQDCAVRAYAHVTGTDYALAHWVFKQAGRRNGTGVYRHVVETVMDSLGWKKVTCKMSVARAMLEYPRSTVYVIMRGHAFAMINGKIYDTGEVGGRCRIRMLWVKPSTTITTASAVAEPAVAKPVQTTDKRSTALALFQHLNNGMRSRYAIAKVIAEKMNITVANANYYVLQF